MGAVGFYKTVEGFDVNDAFETIKRADQYENGHNYYSGTIGSCSLGKMVKSYDKFSEKNSKDAQKIIDSLDGGRKCIADVIDLGVVCYVIRSVGETKKEYTANEKKLYVVCDSDGIIRPIKKHSFKNKKDARADAKNLTLNGHPDIFVDYKTIKIDGNSTISEYHILETKTQKKPKNIKEGTKVLELHKYIFFGFAPE